MGVAAMAACSSTSDDTASGGTGGGSVAGTTSGGSGGTTATGGSGGVDMSAAGSTGCAFLDGPCGTCVGASCLDSETACQKEEACDNALSNGLLACACDPSMAMTIPECTDAFSATDATAKAVADCAKASCKTECGF